MTREEETKEAYKDYMNNSGMFQSNPWFYFKAGTEWADKHQKNVWHDINDEPNKYEYILFEYISKQNELKYFTLYVTPFGNLLKEFEKFGKCRWAYISDLLPKGGQK